MNISLRSANIGWIKIENHLKFKEKIQTWTNGHSTCNQSQYYNYWFFTLSLVDLDNFWFCCLDDRFISESSKAAWLLLFGWRSSFSFGVGSHDTFLTPFCDWYKFCFIRQQYPRWTLLTLLITHRISFFSDVRSFPFMYRCCSVTTLSFVVVGYGIHANTEGKNR